jgi:hypothetical protein
VATFDLRVSMTGLGLFGTQAATKQLHFLMPATDAAAGAAHDHASHHDGAASASHVHSACLVTNAAYLQKDSPSEIHNAVVPFWIGGTFLDLSALGEPQAKTPAEQLPNALLDLGSLAEAHIHPGLVSSSPGDDVASRVTIANAKLECHEPGARWHVTAAAPDVRNMAYLLTWQLIGVTADAEGGIQLQPIEFGSQTAMPLPRLFPTKDKNAIHIWVMHLPPEHMPPFGVKPPQPEFGTEPPHLRMASRLLGPAPKWPTIRFLDNVNDGSSCSPRWPSDRREAPTPETLTRAPHAIAPSGGAEFGDEYTCAGARAEVK